MCFSETTIQEWSAVVGVRTRAQGRRDTHDLSEALARVQRNYEQMRSAVLATYRQHQHPDAEVHPRLFPGRSLSTLYLRRFRDVELLSPGWSA